MVLKIISLLMALAGLAGCVTSGQPSPGADRRDANLSDTTPPTIQLIAPHGNSRVGGPFIHVEVNVEDVGSGVHRVEYSLDKNVVGAAYDPPYKYKVPLASVSPGRHIISARVFDRAGLSSIASAEVTVVRE